jgi:hypothetical protein
MVERNIWSEIEEDAEALIVGKFRRGIPNSIYAFQGDTVILTVKNKAEHVHSLALTEFGVDTGEIEPLTGEKTISFVAEKNGVFKFMCGIPYDFEAEQCDPDHDKQVGYFTVLKLEFEYEEEKG